MRQAMHSIQSHVKDAWIHSCVCVHVCSRFFCLSFHLIFEWNFREQESGPAAVHPWNHKLGSFSKWNLARDFTRFCKVPLETWGQQVNMLCIYTRTTVNVDS